MTIMSVDLLNDSAGRIQALEKEVKQLRVQLAGCGVAAMQNTVDSIHDRAKAGDYGWSASYQDVCKAVDREISYREALKLLADYANHDNRGWEAVFAMMGIAQKALDSVHGVVMPTAAAKKAETSKAAWGVQDMKKGLPHGWIQWKGTSVCMDVYCACGHHSHIDADFAYHVKCPVCGRCYFCNGHIELIELKSEPTHCVVTGE